MERLKEGARGCASVGAMVCRRAIASRKSNSDGCTGVPDFNFRKCCERHDRDYSHASSLTRRQADLGLKACISQYTLTPIIPTVYYVGVRLFGWIFYKKKR